MMTHQSIDDLVIFIRTRITEDESGDYVLHMGYAACLKGLVDLATFVLRTRSEPNIALSILYRIGALWSDHGDYRAEWMPFD